MYLERFIHGEIYRARPDVRAVVHHHLPSVIPFGVRTIPLRAIYHMAAFLGDGVPVFDIREVAAQAEPGVLGLSGLVAAVRPVGVLEPEKSPVRHQIRAGADREENIDMARGLGCTTRDARMESQDPAH